MTPEDRLKWVETNQRLASAALRVLGLAYRELPEGYKEDDLDRDLIFVGLAGMVDPLREEAKAAIATCREAGIRTVMITGDQQATAAEIARQLGIDRDAQGKPLSTMHGRGLAWLDAAGGQLGWVLLGPNGSYKPDPPWTAKKISLRASHLGIATD